MMTRPSGGPMTFQDTSTPRLPQHMAPNSRPSNPNFSSGKVLSCYQLRQILLHHFDHLLLTGTILRSVKSTFLQLKIFAGRLARL